MRDAPLFDKLILLFLDKQYRIHAVLITILIFIYFDFISRTIESEIISFIFSLLLLIPFSVLLLYTHVFLYYLTPKKRRMKILSVACLVSLTLLFIPNKPEFLKPFFDLGYVFIVYGGLTIFSSPHMPGGSDQGDFPTFKKWGRGVVSISKNTAKSVMRFVQGVGRRK